MSFASVVGRVMRARAPKESRTVSDTWHAHGFFDSGAGAFFLEGKSRPAQKAAEVGEIAASANNCGN